LGATLPPLVIHILVARLSVSNFTKFLEKIVFHVEVDFCYDIICFLIFR
jgi:hypothetical protein